MFKVRITPTIAFEYATRDVFDFYQTAGTHDVPNDVAREMEADADFYQHRDGPDVEAALKRSYRAHRDHLRRGLAA